jgi:hypothetical protein
MSSSYRSVGGRQIQRSGSLTIPPIEESPRLSHTELLVEGERLSALSTGPLSSSPSRSSIHSKMSVRSTSSESTSASGESRKTGSRFAPAWLFNPFRSGISQPQTSNVSASAMTSPTLATTPTITPSSSVLMFTSSGLKTPTSRSPKPVNILPRASPRSSVLCRTLEEDSNLATTPRFTNSYLADQHSPSHRSDDRDHAKNGKCTAQHQCSVPVLASQPNQPVIPTRICSVPPVFLGQEMAAHLS